MVLATSVLGCPRERPPGPSLQPPLVVPDPQHEPVHEPEPAMPITPAASEPEVDRLTPVRYQSTDPELAYFASLIASNGTRLEACARSELHDTSIPGFVRVTFDQLVPRGDATALVLLPVVTGIGSAALHECVREALSLVSVPTMLGRNRRKRVAFTVELRIGPTDASLGAEPDHGDTLVLDDTGGCAWLHENPCAPHKSCMAATRRATRCPLGWGSPPRSNAGGLAHRVVYYSRACSDAVDETCTLSFDRTGDACEAGLRRTAHGEADAPFTVAMACVDFERLWRFSARKSLPTAARDGSAMTAEVSIGANHIEPRWSAYRVKRWQWQNDPGPPGELAFFEWLLLDRAASLGLAVGVRLGFDADRPPPAAPRE